MTFENNIETYLKDSESFNEFLDNAELEIYQHLLETTNTIPLQNDVIDYARNIYNEYLDGVMPF